MFLVTYGVCACSKARSQRRGCVCAVCMYDVCMYDVCVCVQGRMARRLPRLCSGLCLYLPMYERGRERERETAVASSVLRFVSVCFCVRERVKERGSAAMLRFLSIRVYVCM